MKCKPILLYLPLLLYDSHAFPVYKVMRVNYKLIKKNTGRLLTTRLNATIANSESDIIERSISIISDNAVNEMIYLLKIYHLTNDKSTSYLYIITYEMIWLGYQLKKYNLLGDKFDMNDEQSQMLLQKLILNISIYLFLKNILINNLLALLNK